MNEQNDLLVPDQSPESEEKLSLKQQTELIKTNNLDSIHLVSNEALSHKTLDILKQVAKPGIEVHIGSLMRAMDRLANLPQVEGTVLVDFDRGTYLANRVILELGAAFRAQHGRKFSSLEFCNLFSESQFGDQFKAIQEQYDIKDQDTIKKVFTTRHAQPSDTRKASIRSLDGVQETDEIRETPKIFSQMLSEMAFPDNDSWLASPEQINTILDLYEQEKVLLVNGDIADQEVWGVIDEFCEIENSQVSILDLSNVYPSWLYTESIAYVHDLLSLSTSSGLSPETVLVQSIPFDSKNSVNGVFFDTFDEWNKVNPFSSELEIYVPYVQTVQDYQENQNHMKRAIEESKEPTGYSLRPAYDLIKMGKMQLQPDSDMYLSTSIISQLQKSE